MRADLVWLHHREPVAVVDAKYKAEKLSGYPNADVYQMLAYCTALGLRVGHLVYARGNEIGMEHRIRNAGITVKAHVVDLTLPPVLLLEDIQRIASEVEASTPALSSLSSFTSRL